MSLVGFKANNHPQQTTKRGSTGVPIFWRISAERHGLDLNAVSRQTGLTMMLGGNAAVATAMGPDDSCALERLPELMMGEDEEE